MIYEINEAGLMKLRNIQELLQEGLSMASISRILQIPLADMVRMKYKLLKTTAFRISEKKGASWQTR